MADRESAAAAANDVQPWLGREQKQQLKCRHLSSVVHCQAEQQTVPTLADAAERVHAEHELGWKNPKHAQQWLNTLKQYAFPVLGTRKVDEIDTPDVLKVLAPIWLTKPEKARCVKQRIGTVMDWVKTSGFRAGENPVGGVLRGLPKQSGQSTCSGNFRHSRNVPSRPSLTPTHARTQL